MCIGILVLLYLCVVNNPLSIRLVGESVPWAGRVEAVLNNVTGRLCKKGWTVANYHVLCRHLGYNGMSGKGDFVFIDSFIWFFIFPSLCPMYMYIFTLYLISFSLLSHSLPSLAIINEANYSQGSGPYWLYELKCTGSEMNLLECTYSHFTHDLCGSSAGEETDVSVFCDCKKNKRKKREKKERTEKKREEN